VLGIPYLEIEAKIPLRPFTAHQPNEPVDTAYLTSQTTYWPVKDRNMTSIVESLTESEAWSKHRVEAILNWINTNIEYGGKIPK